MTNAETTPAFVLHSRAFKETSLILELFTLEHGRVNVLAKGIRSNDKSNRKALIQPFQPISVSWMGRSELKTLKQLDANGLPYRLQGIVNLSGLYINELLLKLLIQWDPQPEIFELYCHSLQQLKITDKPQVALREFELDLLEFLGYAIDWQHDIYGDAIEAEQQYCYQAEQGFIPEKQAPTDALSIAGELILAVAALDWSKKGSLALARKICRNIIDQLLGHKELHSRKLLQETLSLYS
ncbi:MAG: DNA repair protein RecO [Kangiellaceae bacterium]|nr:DNA repair protein RecO [Kangiellaceae bacterium]